MNPFAAVFAGTKIMETFKILLRVYGHPTGLTHIGQRFIYDGKMCVVTAPRPDRKRNPNKPGEWITIPRPAIRICNYVNTDVYVTYEVKNGETVSAWWCIPNAAVIELLP